MSHCQHSQDHICSVSCTPSLSQTLEELDFERGIWYAAQYGDVTRVQKLLKQGTEVDQRDSAGYTALHYAARSGHLPVCEILVTNGCNINAITKAGCATALHRACFAGKVDVVKFLLRNKADCMMQDSDGKTALHRCADIQNTELCSLLVSVCPQLKYIKDCKMKTAAEYARTDDLYNILFTA